MSGIPRSLGLSAPPQNEGILTQAYKRCESRGTSPFDVGDEALRTIGLGVNEESRNSAEWRFAYLVCGRIQDGLPRKRGKKGGKS